MQLDIHNFAQNLRILHVVANKPEHDPANNISNAYNILAKNPDSQIMFRRKDIFQAKDYNVFYNDRYFTVEIQLKRGCDLIDRIVPYMCVDDIVSPFRMIKTQIVLDDHIFEDITDPIPIHRYEHCNAIIRLFYIADTSILNMFTNQSPYIVLEYMAIMLQREHRQQLKSASSCVYLNQLICYDDQAQYNGYRAQIISGNTLYFREKTCDIKQLIFETIDMKTCDTTTNIINRVDLVINDNIAGSFNRNGNIVMIDSLPVYMTIYSEVKAIIYTDQMVDQNIAIVARYKCVTPDPEIISKYRNGVQFEYYNGVLMNGVYAPK